MMQITKEAMKSLIPAAEKQILKPGQRFDNETVRFIECLETKDVVACPGSGKTTSLIAKLFILSKFMPFPNNQGICVLTHTNVAIDEIKIRMGKKSSVLFSYPNFFGTIQGFVDKFLAIPSYLKRWGYRPLCFSNDQVQRRINGLLSNKTKHWLNKQYTDIVASLRLDNSGNLILGINGSAAGFPLKNKQSPTYMDLLKAKLRVLNEGYLTYDEAFWLGHIHINHYPVYKEALSFRFPMVFFDEMQDTYSFQIDLLNKLFSESVMIQHIGDPNQAIYSSSVHQGCDWNPKSGYLTLPNSKRFTNQIAKAIKHVSVKTEPFLTGINFSDDELLAPVMLLYNDTNIKSVLRRYSELISERKHIWKDSVDNPVFWAVGWTHENDELTSDGKVKISIKSYWDEYNDPRKVKKSIYNSILNYLVKPDKNSELLEAKPITDNLISLFLRVLDIARIVDPLTERRFTKTSLKKSIEVKDPIFFTNWLTKLSKWTLMIKKHSCDNVECHTKDLVYPSCILDDLKNFVSSVWTVFFRIAPTTVNDFLSKPLEEIDHQETTDNTYKNNGIEVNVGTVHSVKGQTHTATLFLECFSHGFNGKQLKQFFLNDYADNSDVGPRKINALKIAYVAMSRPTHFLCVAFHEDRFSDSELLNLISKGWKVSIMGQKKSSVGLNN